MKKILFLLFLISSLYAKVFEIKNINQIKPYLKKDSLILFDLDNTIMQTKQLLGSDQWFFYHLNKYVKEGLDNKQALEKTLCDWFEIQAVTKVKLVEEDIKSIIDRYQDKKYCIMGLTTRHLDFAYPALKQLASLNIDLLKTAPFKKNIYFENSPVYKQGILFANGINKGEVLSNFLKKINLKPKSIIFIDDKLNHINEVKNFCEKVNIEFFGFRYGYLDDEIKKFDSKIAEVQYGNFKKILSELEMQGQSPYPKGRGLNREDREQLVD